MLRRLTLLLLVFSAAALFSADTNDLQVLHTPLVAEVTFTLDGAEGARVVSLAGIYDATQDIYFTGIFSRVGDRLIFRNSRRAWELGRIQTDLSAERSFKDPLVGAIRQRSAKVDWGSALPSLAEVPDDVNALWLVYNSEALSQVKDCSAELSKQAP